MRSNITKNNRPEGSSSTASGHTQRKTNGMLKSMLFAGTLIMMVLLTLTSQISNAQYAIVPEVPYTQNFDSLPNTGNWGTPAFWRISGEIVSDISLEGMINIPYSGANNGGNSQMPALGAGCPSGAATGWNCYNTNNPTNRCIGMRGTPSGNCNDAWYVQFQNTSSEYISSFTVSYSILKFMNNNSGYNTAIQLFYSADDNTYTKADTNQFRTFTGLDPDNNCPFSAFVGTLPSQSWSVSGTFFPPQPIAPGAVFYIAWNYATTGAISPAKDPLLGIDDISIVAHSNAPSVCCPTLANITNTSALLGGTVVADNGTAITERGINYSTNSNVTFSSNRTPEGGTGISAYTQTISGLNPQTRYYFAGYAVNGIGDSLTSISNFYTFSNPPTSAASGFTATAISSSQINLGWTMASFPGSGANNTGYLILSRTDGNNPSTTGIVNGVAPASLTLPSGTTLLSTITSGTTTSFNSTGLPSITPYNYTIVPFTWDGTNAATYNYNTSSAPTTNATTLPGAPDISLPTVSNVTTSSATLGATITSNGGGALTARGTVYKTSTGVTFADNPAAEGGTNVSAFTMSRSGLSPQTHYFFAGYATNAGGTSVSTEGNFYTWSNPPSTQAAGLSGTGISGTQINLAWTTGATFPGSGASATGYVLLRAQNPNTPSLASTNGQAPTAGANTTIVRSTIAGNALSYNDTSTAKTGLTLYNYLLVPYTWDGTNAATYNYLTVSAPTGTGRTLAGSLYKSGTGTWNHSSAVWGATSSGPFTSAWADTNSAVFLATGVATLTLGANNMVTSGISFNQAVSTSAFNLTGPAGDTLILYGSNPSITYGNAGFNSNGVLTATIKALSSNPVTFSMNSGATGAVVVDLDGNNVFPGGIIIGANIGRTNINSSGGAGGNGAGPIQIISNGVNQTGGMRFSNHNANNTPNDIPNPNTTITIPNDVVLNPTNVHPSGGWKVSMGATNNANLLFTNWTGVISGSPDTLFLGNAPGLNTGGGAGHAQFSNHCTYSGVTCNNSSSSGIFTNGIDDAFSPNADYLFAPASGSWDLNGHNQRLRSLAGPGAGISNSQSTLSTLTIQGSLNTIYSGSLSGNIGITLSSSNTGSLTLTGVSSHTGNTVVSGGTLVLKTSPRNSIFSHSSLTVNGGTLRDSTQQTIGNVNLSSGTLFIASGDTLYVDSTFNFTGGTLTVNGVLQINSTGKLLCGTNIVSGSGKVIISNGATLEMADVNGITSAGATGNIQVSGTRTFSTSANFIYDGASAQVTGNGLPAAVNNLTVNNSNGLSLTNAVTVNGTLTFTSGIITTGGNNVAVGSAGNVTGASSTRFINGNLIKNLATGTTAINFEIGNGGNYTPVNLVFNGSGVTSAAGSLLAFTTNGDHPNVSTSMITALKSADRYWTLTPNNLTINSSYNATFNFVSSDLDAGANTSAFIGSVYSAGSWTQPGVGNRTATSTQLTGVTSFGDIQVGEPCTIPTITPNITNVSIYCGTNGSISPSISGGTSPFVYNWSNGSTNLSINNLAAGTYNLTVSGNGGCFGIFNYTVTQPAAIVVVSGNLNTCAGGSTNLTASGFTTYTWSPASGLNTTSGPSVTCHLPSLNPLTYTVTGTNSCGSTSTSFTVTVGNPTFTYSYTNNLCYGDSSANISLNANNGSAPYTYNVTNMINNTVTTHVGNGSFTHMVPTRYKLQVTDNTGCTSALSTIITTQPSQLTFNYAATNITCNGSNNGSITLTAGGGTGTKTYTNNGGTTYQAGNVFSSLSPASYVVRVKDANGCISAVSNTVTITQPAVLSFTTVSINSSCSGNTGQIIVYTSGGYGIYNFSKNGGTTYQSSYIFSNLAPDTYPIIVRDANGCTTAVQNVTVGCSGARMESGTSAQSFNVYPNPASQKTIVSFSSNNESNYTLRIADMQERVLRTYSAESTIGDNQVELDLSAISRGLYFVTLNNGDTLLQTKLVVQ